MIDPNMFTVEGFLSVLMDDVAGNVNAWRKHAEIVPRYFPPYRNTDTRAKCVVRCGSSFLRHSAGPRQGYFWDCYGDDFINPELALIALCAAPVPPDMVRRPNEEGI